MKLTSGMDMIMDADTDMDMDMATDMGTDMDTDLDRDMETTWIDTETGYGMDIGFKRHTIKPTLKLASRAYVIILYPYN
jgi:hypothetical protein